jgi:hypothetical protein
MSAHIGDVLVSATTSIHGRGSGSVYVVFGRPAPATVDLARKDFVGFRIDGAHAYDAATVAAAAGDVNGDGLGDVIVGSPKADTAGAESGAAYVVFGKKSPSTVLLADDAGSWGYAIEGAAAGDQVGTAVAGARDINGDGVPDLLLGAPEASNAGRTGAGSVYVVYGQAEPLSAVTLADVGVVPTLGFRIDGAHAEDALGTAVAMVPDVDDDHVSDVLAGAPAASPHGRRLAGAAYLVSGRPVLPTVDLAMPAKVLREFDGAASTDGLGLAVTSGRGFAGRREPDLVLGAPGLLQQEGAAGRTARTPAAPDDRSNGHTYLLTHLSGSSPVDLRERTAWRLRLTGSAAQDHIGGALALLGDLDHDGRRELGVGNFDSTSSDRMYIVTGGASGADVLDGSLDGCYLAGPAGSRFGASVADGHGAVAGRRHAVVVGAPDASPGGRSRAGVVKVFVRGHASREAGPAVDGSEKSGPGDTLPDSGADEDLAVMGSILVAAALLLRRLFARWNLLAREQ